MNLSDLWHSLDSIAATNLEGSMLQNFFTYRDQLKREEYKWEDAEMILSGYVWDASEEAGTDINE